MKKLLLMLLGMLMTFPMLARDFEYTYEGHTLIYTVISEEDKTCRTKEGNEYIGGNNVSGNLIIPTFAIEGENKYEVIEISDYSFYRCIRLVSVEIPATVTTIGARAFVWCYSLPSVSIPNSVTTIGEEAFCECGSLESVELPNSVTTIRESAFSGCYSLASVYYNAEEPISASSNVFYSNVYKNATLYVPAGAVEKCKLITPWKKFKSIQAYDFTGINDVAADIDDNLPCEVYTTTDVKVADSTDGLATGIYIVRQGDTVKKIAVN